MKKLWLTLMVLGLAVAVTGAWAYTRPAAELPPTEPPPFDERVARQDAFDLDVLINGRPAAEYRHRGRVYVEALAGEEYELRVRNPLGVRVAVALSVDGLNTIDARRTSPQDASKWVIEPYATITISGWQMSDTRARRFYFTSERDSYAAKIGQPGNFGVIAAVFFRERRPVVILPKRTGRDEDKARANESEAPSAAGQSAPRSASKPAPNDDYAATGIGRNTRHDVTWTNMDLESQPAGETTLRYEFRDSLVRLGILPRQQPRYAPDPLNRRERSTGFSPEPR
jgi:hypothetical protein